VLRAAVSLVLEATGADACFLHRWDAERRRLMLAAASAPYDALVGSVTLEPGEGISGWVAANRRPVVIAAGKDADPRYKYIPELEGEKYTSMVSVPVVAPEDRLVGVVNVHTRRRRDFREEDVAFLQDIASLIASAIEGAELLSQLREKERALEELVRTTIQAQEEERRRVATEIHDGVTQQLVSTWYRVHACERLLATDPAAAAGELAATKALIDEALGEARAAIYDLRPATLDDLGLVPSLEVLLGRAFADDDVEVRLDAQPVRLAKHLEVALYRVAQEAVSNIKRHAGARRVTIALLEDPDGVVLRIADDGRGFDLEAYRRKPPGTSFGLAGIQERVRLLGGTLRVRSAPGAGTALEIRVAAGDAGTDGGRSR
jgi:two-component system NarL family sensor kinase